MCDSCNSGCKTSCGCKTSKPTTLKKIVEIKAGVPKIVPHNMKNAYVTAHATDVNTGHDVLGFYSLIPGNNCQVNMCRPCDVTLCVIFNS